MGPPSDPGAVVNHELKVQKLYYDHQPLQDLA